MTVAFKGVWFSCRHSDILTARGIFSSDFIPKWLISDFRESWVFRFHFIEFIWRLLVKYRFLLL